LPQERAQSLDERIFQTLPRRIRNEEPVQPTFSASEIFSACQLGVIWPLSMREIGRETFQARLLALGHAARFAQLADALADILDRL
jgi:hypothetical protein